MSRLPAAPILALLVGTACKPVVPEDDTDINLEVPDSVSDVLEAFWLDWAEGSPERLGDLAAIAMELVDEDALSDDAVFGNQRRLSTRHMSVVDRYAPPGDDGSWAPPNPKNAAAVYLLNRFACSESQLERVLYHLDQNDLYEAYVSYERSYTTPFADYTGREADRLDWTATLTASNVIYGEYEETLLGGMRRLPIPADAPGDWASDHFLVARTWLPYPAISDSLEFEQDYQLEIYLPWGDQEIVHLYGVWRELRSGLVDFENEGIQSIMLSNLAGWDDTTERLCAEPRP